MTTKNEMLAFFIFLVAIALILILPLVQHQYKYHLFKVPLVLQVLSFGRAKGEEDPLF